MKVMHVMRTYGAHGGEQQLSQLFGGGERAARKEVFVFVFQDPECAALFAEKAPHLRQVSLLSLPLSTGSAWREFLRILPRLPLLQWRFWRLLRQCANDVCVVHGFQAALVAWPAAFLRPSIGWAYVHRTTKKTRRFNLVFRWLYMPFSVVAGNSHAVMGSLAPYVSADRLVALYNGIDLATFDRRRSDASAAAMPMSLGRVLIVVGRLLPNKGQDLVIAALAHLLPEHRDLELWIVGEGSAREDLERKVAALGLQGRALLLGHRFDVAGLLGRATIFVNASAVEGMSNAVLEGMAAGLPSVVADAPGVSECHVNEVTALVVSRDPLSLAQGIARLLEDPIRAQSMGQAARERVEVVYSIESNRQRYNALYERLTGG